jgi:hypothetical protein
MTAKICATDLEDWPALQRAMQEAGEEFRQGKITPLPVATTTSLRSPEGERSEPAIGGVR